MEDAPPLPDYDDVPAPAADDYRPLMTAESSDSDNDDLGAHGSDSENEAPQHHAAAAADVEAVGPMPRTPSTPAGKALAMATGAAGSEFGALQMAFDADNEYGWFRADKLAGWAGPTHWKFRRVQSKGMLEFVPSVCVARICSNIALLLDTYRERRHGKGRQVESCTQAQGRLCD